MSFAVDTLNDTHFAQEIKNELGQVVNVVDANNQTSLRAVIEYANAHPLNGNWNANRYSVDLTQIAGGTITLNSNLGFRTLPLHMNFDFFCNGSDVEIDRSAAPNTPAFNHFDVYPNKESHFSAITFWNGKSSTDGGSIWNGGRAEFSYCTFTNNESAGCGGAIATSSGGTTMAFSCTFMYNSASWANGGGGAIAALSGSLVTNITNCTLMENETVGNGGAVWADGAGSLWIDGCYITWNRATGDWTSLGGGVYVEATNTTINQTYIGNNQAGWRGGGLYVLDCSLTMTGGQLTGNTSAGHGGGFYIAAVDKTVTLNQVSITDNTATGGKGVGDTSGTAR